MSYPDYKRIKELESQIAAKDAEIERLKAESVRWQQDHAMRLGELEDRDAEIERLKQANLELTVENQSIDDYRLCHQQIQKQRDLLRHVVEAAVARVEAHKRAGINAVGPMVDTNCVLIEAVDAYLKGTPFLEVVREERNAALEDAAKLIEIAQPGLRGLDLAAMIRKLKTETSDAE